MYYNGTKKRRKKMKWEETRKNILEESGKELMETPLRKFKGYKKKLD